MTFIKVETSDGETRWINLAHLVRATLAHETETGELILAITLSTDHGSPVVRIHGTDDMNRSAIDQIIRAMEELTHAPLHSAA